MQPLKETDQMARQLLLIAMFAFAVVNPVHAMAADDAARCAALLAQGDARLGLKDDYGAALKKWEAAYPVCQSWSTPADLQARAAVRWGTVLIERGQLADAEQVYRKAISSLEQKAGVSNKVLIPLLKAYVELLDRTQRLDDAERLALRNLAISEQEKEPTEIVYAYLIMGQLQVRRSAPELAELYFRKAIEVAENSCGPKCLQLAGAYGALANLLKTLPGREAEVKELNGLQVEAVPD
jgi:tetratricopeptide (TPR) repeat protein